MATNQLIDVVTYQKSLLAKLQNSFAYIEKANTQFREHQNFKGNLGTSISFELPIKFAADRSSLEVTTFQPTKMRQQTLTVDEPINVAYEYSNQETIYNVSDYMKDFGDSAVAEIGGEVEANVALNNLTHTYRTFGDGVTDLNSFQQLAQAAANYRNTGSPKVNLCGIIPDIKDPAIVGNGLAQFVPRRNDEIAMSWDIGKFANVNWYTSNLCPTHTAGTVGETAQTLTVKVINSETQLTLSGATASDADAIKKNDILTFQDSVSGVDNIRFLTEYGHQVSQQKVQVRATADAGADGSGDVVVNIFPALNSTAGDSARNISTAVVADMELKALKSHLAGILFYEPALMLGMPQLNKQDPFPTANSMDPDSKVAIRLTYGSIFGKNLTGFIHDALWGSTLVDEYAMRLAFTV